MTETIEIPFLVVGAGPVGLTAALLLAASGRPAMVIERRTGPQAQPAAHVVNARTLEILRQVGVDMAAVEAISLDPATAGHVNFLTTLDGELIGRLPFERQGDECRSLTPTPLRNISQHHLEPVLAAEVAESATTQLRYGVEWVSSEQDDDGVTSTVRDVTTGECWSVRSDYLIAADGAGSRIRSEAGIPMIGPAAIQSFVAIHFLADLTSVVDGRPGVLHFVMDPSVAGTFVAHDPSREWVLMVGFDPERETVDDYDRSRCAAIVAAAIGTTPIPVEIVGAGTWHMTAQVAERLRDRRVFLVGDAAHRFPPTGGLGLNTGVADAHNLVWKLGAVADGWAHRSLLDTYGTERRPVAETNCEQSTTNAFKMVLLVEALGLDATSTGETLAATLADPARRDGIAAAVQEQATHFDMLGLQLGYVYTEGALARAGAARSAPGPIDDDPRRFDPDASVGGRLPHGELADGRSTLDLVATDAFTLLTTSDHDRWAEAVAALDGAVGSRRVPIRVIRLGVDVDVEPPWATTCRLDDVTALLVRPDQHIAWRGRAADGLVDALGAIVGTASWQ